MAFPPATVINPRVIFVQDTEPSDVTEGKLWYDTTENEIKVSNGTSYTAIAGENPKIQSVDTSTDLDISASTTTSATKEYTITSANLVGATYVNIDCLAYWEAIISASGSGSRKVRVKYKIETKEVGGSYSTALDEDVIVSGSFTPSVVPDVNFHLKTISYLHTLTASEISDGITIKLTTNFTLDSGSTGSGKFTNKQIVISSMK